jgi:hypothetical protein
VTGNARGQRMKTGRSTGSTEEGGLGRKRAGPSPRSLLGVGQASESELSPGVAGCPPAWHSPVTSSLGW